LHSPIGVYLRREVLKNEGKSDITVKRRLYEKIVANQLADGSWDKIFVRTANNLWNLALLGYTVKNKNIERGLKWLLRIHRHQYRGYPGFFLSENKEDTRLMRSTFYGEFGPGCTILYQTAYSIHIFHIFGFSNNRQILTTVNSILQFWRPGWCGAWCTINIFRVLIEHPLSAESKQVQKSVKHLAKKQSKLGAWKGFPFYHTFHALSIMNNVIAKKQLEKALPLVIKRQNKNGSWGRKDPETETFLVLDGLKNSELL
ncbi:MAG: hypothetical protein JSV51_07545, partial [Candidatus Bathyarchaeota archaeon]